MRKKDIKLKITIPTEMAPHAMIRRRSMSGRIPGTMTSSIAGPAIKTPAEIRRNHLWVQEQLGQGFYGTVYKAVYTHDSGQATVAIKSFNMLDSSSDIASTRAAMMKEASIMTLLDHPNVVKLIGIVSIGDPVLVVLELCEMGDLRNYLLTNELANHVLLQFCCDCADGMKYLSSKRIVHRDLAARNVLLTNELRCKISDYGLSRATLDKTYYRGNGKMLPLRWTAPEALEGNIFSEQTDVWSYGVLVFEIWSKGSEPYEGLNTRQAWIKISGGYRPPCPERCPANVYALMRDTWAANGDRPGFGVIVDRLTWIIQLQSAALLNGMGAGDTEAKSPTMRSLTITDV